jgi:hypothetical protein
MKSRRIIVPACLLALTALQARAIDLGDPLYAPDVEGKSRLEILYEYYDREAAFDDLTLTVEGPGGTGSTTTDLDDEAEADQDLYTLRWTPMIRDRSAFYVDAGLVDHEDGDDLGYGVGAGARYLAAKQGRLRINIVGALHYVPPFDIENDDVRTELSYWEASGGVLASGLIDLDPKTAFVPYGGVVFSMVDGEVESEVDLGDAVARGEANFEEEDLPILVVGGTLLFNKKISVRAEGRLIGDESFSLGVGSVL